MCRYFCIGFVNFILKGKSLLDYANLLLQEDQRIWKNDKIILKYFAKIGQNEEILFKKHAKIVFLVRTYLNKIEVFIFKSLADSYISHAEFVSTNNVLMC